MEVFFFFFFGHVRHHYEVLKTVLLFKCRLSVPEILMTHVRRYACYRVKNNFLHRFLDAKINSNLPLKINI